MPFNYAVSVQPIATDVTTLLGRLTAARATALDELLAANLPADIAALNAQNVLILADTLNLLADVLIINQVLTPEIADILQDTSTTIPAQIAALTTLYTYSGALANNADFTPPANTIVMTAFLDVGAPAQGDLEVRHGTVNRTLGENSAAAGDANLGGLYGAIMCDGANVKFRNLEGAQQDLLLTGYTIG